MDADDEIVENDSTPEPSISIPGAFPPARPDISQLAGNTKIFIEGKVYRSTKDPKIVKTPTGARVLYDDIGRKPSGSYWAAPTGKRRHANAVVILGTEAEKLSNPELQLLD
jgi:hypothetical protein